MFRLGFILIFFDYLKDYPFRYWLRPGTQVEVCSVDENDTPLSCAYLQEEQSPGPIEIDVEPYRKAFRVGIEIL